MKKKLTVLFSLIVCAVALLLALPACESSSSDLQFDKKYVNLPTMVSGEIESYEDYYVFYSNGTGIYRYCYKYIPELELDFGLVGSDYTITFKYTFTDKDNSSIVCFFDSVEYGEKNSDTIKSNWAKTATVSKNIVNIGPTYINEDYLKEIPNFNS